MKRKLSSNQKGQNLIEYLLLAAAVCVVAIVFLSPTGIFKTALENSLNDVMIGSIEYMAQNVTLNTSLLP